MTTLEREAPHVMATRRILYEQTIRPTQCQAGDIRIVRLTQGSETRQYRVIVERIRKIYRQPRYRMTLRILTDTESTL